MQDDYNFIKDFINKFKSLNEYLLTDFEKNFEIIDNNNNYIHHLKKKCKQYNKYLENFENILELQTINNYFKKIKIS